jgi:thiol-disulfide isomerase/thioredoxin
MVKTKVILYHAKSWCVPCQRFMPEWEKFKEANKDKYDFEAFDDSIPTDKKCIIAAAISSYPSMNVILPGEKPIPVPGFDSSKTAENLKTMIAAMEGQKGGRRRSQRKSQRGGNPPEGVIEKAGEGATSTAATLGQGLKTAGIAAAGAAAIALTALGSALGTAATGVSGTVKEVVKAPTNAPAIFGNAAVNSANTIVDTGKAGLGAAVDVVTTVSNDVAKTTGIDAAMAAATGESSEPGELGKLETETPSAPLGTTVEQKAAESSDLPENVEFTEQGGNRIPTPPNEPKPIVPPETEKMTGGCGVPMPVDDDVYKQKYLKYRMKYEQLVKKLLKN